MDDLLKKLNVLMRARVRTLIGRSSSPRASRAPAPPAENPPKTAPSLDPVLEDMQRTIDRLNNTAATQSDLPPADDDLARRIDRLSRK